MQSEHANTQINIIEFISELIEQTYFERKRYMHLF